MRKKYLALKKKNPLGEREKKNPRYRGMGVRPAFLAFHVAVSEFSCDGCVVLDNVWFHQKMRRTEI
jgi:hypothetical protein